MAKRKRKSLDEIARDAEKIIKHKEPNENGEQVFEKTIEKAVKPKK